MKLFYRLSAEGIGAKQFKTFSRWKSARRRWTRWEHIYAYTAGTWWGWGGATHHFKWLRHSEFQHWPWCPQYQHWNPCKFSFLKYFIVSKEILNQAIDKNILKNLLYTVTFFYMSLGLVAILTLSTGWHEMYVKSGLIFPCLMTDITWLILVVKTIFSSSCNLSNP